MKIADIGSGPVSTVQIWPSDKRVLDGIEQQDMEKVTYDDESFDVVHSENALDHTKDALSALKEMLRICRPGGYVYIKCWLDQKNTGYKHFWNVKEDGTVTNGKDTFDLKDFGFNIEYHDMGGERRYSYIIATLKK